MTWMTGFVTGKKPSDTVCILPDEKPLISLSRDSCFKFTCCKRKNSFINVKVEVETVLKA
jgi:hypothetical protein